MKSPPAELTPQQRTDSLKHWGNRHRQSLGVLLTPPRGHLSPEVRQARDYVQSMVDRLAGPELEDKGVHLVVNLYSGPELNAFMGQQNERLSPWMTTTRRLLGFADDGKPVYELGINAGTLRKLEYEEELAFVLSHELAHLFEGHTDGLRSRWVSYQAHEAVADHQGFERMVAAGYDPEGGLKVLDKIHGGASESPNLGTLLEAVQKGVSTHHHEGVRVALAQVDVERLRRTDPRARPQPQLTPLPDEVRLAAAPRLRSETDLARASQGVTQLVQGFLEDETLKVGDTMLPANPPYLYGLKPDGGQAAELFLAGVEQIRNSNHTPQRKVDSVLHLYAALTKQWGEPTLASEDRAHLSQFLLAQTIAPNGWRCEPFLAGMRDKDQSGRSGFARWAMLSPAWQAIVKALPGINGEWKQLVDSFATLMASERFPHGSQERTTLWTLSEHYEAMQKRPASSPIGPLEGEYALGLAALVGRLAEGLNPQESTAARAVKRTLLCGVQAPRDPALAERIRQAVGPACEAFRQTRASQMADAFEKSKLEPAPPERMYKTFSKRDGGRYWDGYEETRPMRMRHPGKEDPGVVEPMRLGTRLQQFFESDAIVPLAPEELDALRQPMLELVRRANHEPEFFYTEPSQATLPLTRVPGMADLLASMLTDPKLSSEDHAEVRRFMLLHSSFDENPPRRSEPFTKLAASVAELPKSELLRLVETDCTAQYAKSFTADLVCVVHDAVPDLTNDVLFRLKPVERAHGWADRQPERERGPEHNLNTYLERELNPRLSPLALLEQQPEACRRFVESLSSEEYDRMLATVVQLVQRAKAVSRLGTRFFSHLSSDATAVLVKGLIHRQRDLDDLNEWHRRAEQILEVQPLVLDGRAEQREQLAAHLFPRLMALPSDQLGDWLQRRVVRSVLSADQLAAVMVRQAEARPEGVEAVMKLVLLDPKKPNEPLDAARLRDKNPALYRQFRERFSEAARLQPHEVDSIFPPDARSDSDKVESLSKEIRGLSALVAATRGRSIEEQMQMLDFLLGRAPVAPDFVRELDSELHEQSGGRLPSLLGLLEDGRSQLGKADVGLRTVVANSFLAGPNSYLRTPEGRAALLDRMLRDVRPQHQDLARTLAEVLLEAQGSTDSLAVAFVLAQPPGQGGKVSEASILNSLFDAYGVPGIKFKQYLAFTSEFAECRPVFEASQDLAMPLSYYQAVKLVQHHYGEGWPREWRVEEVKGSGSVNVAVKYHDGREHRVVSLAREDVAVNSQYDFHRLRRFLEVLTRDPERRERYGYMLGLADIIQDSVGLEFDKPAAFAMQQSVQELYHRQVDGWSIRTVAAYEQRGGAITMEEARGRTARRVANEDPATYRSAMRALARVELDALLGIDQQGGARPVPLVANPDFHDGQVLIDPDTRTVTLLDFGQAVPISNREREYAADLLAVTAGVHSPHGAAELLRGWTGANLSAAELAPILASRDSMDVFVRLVGMLAQNGNKVPLPVVHWILGMNRQRALGQRIGRPVEPTVRNLVVGRRLGLPQAVSNSLHLACQLVPGPFRGLLRHLLG